MSLPLFSFLGLAEATPRQSIQVGVQVRALALGKQFFTVPCPHTTGTARLPEASQSPLVLKQVVRKPLEAVLRYLGKLDGWDMFLTLILAPHLGNTE